MRITPQPWSHHHVHRLFHISQLAGYAFIIAVLISGSLTVWQQSHADNIELTDSVEITANVAQINPGPAVISPGAGGDGPIIPLPPQPGAPESGPSQKPYLSIEPRAEKPLATKNGTPVFPSGYISFQGQSNITNGVVFLQINGRQSMRSSAYVNPDGTWFWTAPTPLADGAYTITATAMSQTDPAIRASASLKFLIETGQTKPGSGQPATPSVPTSGPETGGLNIAVRIPERFKTIQPGAEFMANLDFFQPGAPAEGTPAQVHYRVENGSRAVIMDSTERMIIPPHLSLIKSFTTSAGLSEGMYRLIVSVDTKEIITAASDTFTVRGAPVVLLTAPARIDYTLAMQILFGLVLLFAFIAYFEYRKVVILSRVIQNGALPPGK